MDYIEAKNYLRHYRDLSDRLEVINNRLLNVKAVSYQPTPGGGRHKTINDYIDEKYALKKEMAEIEAAVAKVQDYRCRMVLIYKYFEGYTLEQVANDCMHYSLRQIKKFHSQGINNLTYKL